MNTMFKDPYINSEKIFFFFKKTESGPAICFGYAFGGSLVETLILCMWWCLTYEIWINRRTVCQFPGHQGAVRGLTASTDGSTLVSCGTDCT
jgi:hypothetical protein